MKETVLILLSDIQLAILKSFGVQLSQSEIEEVHNWFEVNKESISDSKKLRSELSHFVYSKNKGKLIELFEEDTSNLDYLLLLLNQGKKK